jgi:hypothetical protein
MVECHDSTRVWITLDCLRKMVAAIEQYQPPGR